MKNKTVHLLKRILTYIIQLSINIHSWVIEKTSPSYRSTYRCSSIDDRFSIQYTEFMNYNLIRIINIYTYLHPKNYTPSMSLPFHFPSKKHS